MLIKIYAQVGVLAYPPTPTPFPTPSSLPIQFPELSAWDYTDSAIQTWNATSIVTVFFQAVVVVSILFFIATALLKIGKYLSKPSVR